MNNVGFIQVGSDYSYGFLIAWYISSVDKRNKPEDVRLTFVIGQSD